MFAKGVILVEGDAEEIVIPILVKEVFGISLDELGISLINIGSTGFQNVAQLFHDDRIQRKCAIITDLDAAICNTEIDENESTSVQKYKAKVARSAKNGLERKEKLDSFTKDNRWLKACYAAHTFEVDFMEVSEKNRNSISKLADQIYTDQNKISTTIGEISFGEKDIYGRRVLRMANHVGKGWFAIMLGGIINHNTVIPNYILDALVFAKDEYSTQVIVQMIQYRLDKLEIDEAQIQDLLTIYFDKNNLEEMITELKIIIPEDQFITILEKINTYV